MKNTIIFLSIVVFFGLNQNIFAYSQEVIFSEIQRMGTTNSSFDEWIELKNLSGNDIDLNGRVVVSEDGTPNISLQRVIKSNGYFLLERTDDNSAYQVKGDLFYSGSLENGGEVLLLKNKNGEIVDMVDGWSAGKSSGRVSMLRDENLNWVDGIMDGDPKSSFSESVNGNQDGGGMIENGNDEINGNGQNGQSGQSDQDSDGNVGNDMQDQSDTGNSGGSQGDQILDISSFDFDFQSPSYILNKEDKNQSEFFCDKSKSECKINFNFEKTFENSPDGYSKSKFYCKIKFGDLSTDQENKCNPNTVIFPIGETKIEFEVFLKEGNVLQFKKEITIKNIESQSSQNGQNGQNGQNNSSAPVSKRK
ncbi:lamin tail domain-containing protein, partial [Candidatus Gracilibacteria bacterium]|nr:lamin tail domain-containing protein [Candidatus Gracilibacteria bacterium]